MNPEILTFHQKQTEPERQICERLYKLINQYLPEAENKVWHAHPVWFLEGNPIVGYSKLKAGIRLMFWSGRDFEEDKLHPGTGKFKDASILFTSVDNVKEDELKRWIEKSSGIQWDYKNIVKRKGRLIRLK